MAMDSLPKIRELACWRMNGPLTRTPMLEFLKVLSTKDTSLGFPFRASIKVAY